MAELSALCCYHRGLLACSTDGHCYILAIKESRPSEPLIRRENVQPSAPAYKLVVESTCDVCYNSCVIKIFKSGKGEREYIVIGTEEGFVNVYQHNGPTLSQIATFTCCGSILDIVQGESNALLSLWVSCEGDCGYELTLEGTSFQSTIHQKCQASLKLRLHRIWVYPTGVCCSCDQVAECVYLTLPSTSMRIELDLQGNMSLVDQREERFIISLAEPVRSFRAFVTEHSKGAQIALVCRTKFFFQIYTDVFKYYNCLC